MLLLRLILRTTLPINSFASRVLLMLRVTPRQVVLAHFKAALRRVAATGSIAFPHGITSQKCVFLIPVATPLRSLAFLMLGVTPRQVVLQNGKTVLMRLAATSSSALIHMGESTNIAFVNPVVTPFRSLAFLMLRVAPRRVVAPVYAMMRSAAMASGAFISSEVTFAWSKNPPPWQHISPVIVLEKFR